MVSGKWGGTACRHVCGVVLDRVHVLGRWIAVMVVFVFFVWVGSPCCTEFVLAVFPEFFVLVFCEGEIVLDSQRSPGLLVLFRVDLVGVG